MKRDENGPLILPYCFSRQIIEEHLSKKAFNRGYTRAFCRSELLPLGFCIDSEAKVCYVQCRVPPSMRTAEAYLVFLELAITEAGSVVGIVDGFCHCPAGIKYDCQHVGAALWSMNDVAVQSGKLVGGDGVSCTSRLRAWGVASGNLKSDVRIPMDQWVFRKHIPKRDKGSDGKKKREEGRKRLRTVAELYARTKQSCVLKNIAQEPLLAASMSLGVINQAHVSGKTHDADLSLYTSVDWKNLDKTNYPFAPNYVLPRRTSPRKRKQATQTQ